VRRNVIRDITETDIRATKLPEKFQSSENLICSLFAKQAIDDMQKLFLKYSNNIKSSKQLTDIIEYTFFVCRF